MDKTEEQIQSILEQKPVKPRLEEYSLTEELLKKLNDFKYMCGRRSRNYLLAIFMLISGIGVVISINYNSYGLIILTTIASAIITWGLTPFLIKIITKNELVDLIFQKIKTSDIAIIDKSNQLYSAAMTEYDSKNRTFERAIGRLTNDYWLSLNPKEFEEAVAELFQDKGWTVYTTPTTRDNGVDLFLEKDGTSVIVQCKTYKKVLGPNAVRDLYGTMTAHNAVHAYLAAPGGFSVATKTFCEGKPITLLDIDDLTKMFYPFEHYVPHWISSAKSMDDIQKGMKKHMYGGKPYNRRRY